MVLWLSCRTTNNNIYLAVFASFAYAYHSCVSSSYLLHLPLAWQACKSNCCTLLYRRYLYHCPVKHVSNTRAKLLAKWTEQWLTFIALLATLSLAEQCLHCDTCCYAFIVKRVGRSTFSLCEDLMSSSLYTPITLMVFVSAVPTAC
jgi:hypothetical protein